jgi:hypothetical protein
MSNKLLTKELNLLRTQPIVLHRSIIRIDKPVVIDFFPRSVNDVPLVVLHSPTNSPPGAESPLLCMQLSRPCTRLTVMDTMR